MKKLTAKQKRFTEEYIVDGNASQAAIRAGYRANNARVIGCQNLTKVNIKQEIERRQAELTKKTEYTQEVGLAKLMHAYDIAEQLKQPSAMVSAAVGANRMHGFDKDNNTKDATIIIISPPSGAKTVESEVIE